jgi:hypothetical protein
MRKKENQGSPVFAMCAVELTQEELLKIEGGATIDWTKNNGCGNNWIASPAGGYYCPTIVPPPSKR